MFNSLKLEEIARLASAEARAAALRQDEVVAAWDAADEAGNDEAWDKLEAEHKRLKYAMIDLEDLAEALTKAAQALEGLEVENPDYLMKLGLK